MNFDQYYNSDTSYQALYRNIPIELLSEFMRVNKQLNKNLRIRYRGPRMEYKRVDDRNVVQCYSECLKNRAVSFSVYLKK